MTQEQVIINDKQFDSLFGMIQSTDQDNAVVALHCMENCDFQKSLGALLYLYKHSKCDDNLWMERAPKLTAKLKGLGVKMGEDITFEQAFKILSEQKAHPDSFHFLAGKLGGAMREELASWGYDWIATIDIKITLKDEALGEFSKGG